GETGSRTVEVLLSLLRNETRYHKELYKTDFLIPLNLGCTTIEPCKSLLGRGLNSARENLEPNGHISFAAGFSLSDILEAGPAIITYSSEKNLAKSALNEFKFALLNAEGSFDEVGESAEVVVKKAIEISSHKQQPVVIADTQDNPGAGGCGDTTGLLKALIALEAEGAVIGFISDEQAAKKAHAAGIGNVFNGDIGGKKFKGDSPVEGTFKVLALGNGELVGTGPMWYGARMQLGSCALLEYKGIKIAISSKTVQTGDGAMFRHLGIEPENTNIIALKSSVHFRADFERFAGAILIALAPGPVVADPRKLEYRKLRAGVRVGPGIPSVEINH
ncbi:MAG: MlrC C-terminal domain-containing protein, partial [Sneathiella sp.]|nr:MlrC C-terminal domain-containing protein [Sneathiella sp.]